MVAVSLILTGSLICLFTFWIWKLEKIRRNVDKLGGPKSLPVIGNIHQLKRNPKGNKIRLNFAFSIADTLVSWSFEPEIIGARWYDAISDYTP